MASPSHPRLDALELIGSPPFCPRVAAVLMASGRPSAFVVGANGITGSFIIEHILNDPKSPFDRIVATSRRPPNEDWLKKDLPEGALGSRLTWVSADLYEESVEQLAEKFGKAGVGQCSVLFWGAYLLGDGWGSPRELDLNTKMFDQCLRATLAVTKGKLKRVLLQLGEKWYSRHPTPALPQRETFDDPQPSIAPFYASQLSIARSLAPQHGFSWTVTLPQCIYGATRQCAQTLATSLGVWAYAHKLLGMPLVFPGNVRAWNAVMDGSDAALLAELNVWAATEAKCENEILNAVNGDVYQWKFAWYRIGAFFGCEVPPEEEMLKLISHERGMPTFKLGERITEEMLAKAWSECKKSGPGKDDPGFVEDAWKAAVPFNFLDIVFSIEVNIFQSMTKVRRLGFNGYIDTDESFCNIFERMQRDGVFPRQGLPGREAAQKAFKY
ncbi:hypothetical protein DFJ74DRAFT_771954 [Hyaloraphidium curvatum]|nr:hypothetical protein DFJ74DRAFT_771954 [Hyaloraphidium curvatum]